MHTTSSASLANVDALSIEADPLEPIRDPLRREGWTPSDSTIWRLCLKGKLRHVRLGNKLWNRASWVRAFLDARTGGSDQAVATAVKVETPKQRAAAISRAERELAAD
ncbi:MAG: hypothetical protein K8U03_01395 [Planctomycetia bacterium]|nr:hypothetical protein [Planctomycetia bacterium]